MESESKTALEQLQKSIQTFDSLTVAQETRDKLYRYNDALMQSLYSILEDDDCDEAVKLETFNTTMEQYTAAMQELFPQLLIPRNNPLIPKVCKADTDRFDEIEEVKKFNPYHDSKGRFATAQGYSSFTIQTKDPNKQHWADAAIAREKERNGGAAAPTKPKENPLNDPSSLVGAKRGEPMSREEANGGKANPNFEQGGGYRTNCQSCVVAYEARLRGYDVQAKSYGSDKQQGALARNSTLAWEDPATGRLPKHISGGNEITTPKKCREWLENTVEQGARYTFENAWKGRGMTGHIISCDRDSSGALRFYDPQSGKQYKGAEIDSYLNRCKYTTTFYGTKVNVAPKLLRVDNLTINTDMASHIMEAA